MLIIIILGMLVKMRKKRHPLLWPSFCQLDCLPEALSHSYGPASNQSTRYLTPVQAKTFYYLFTVCYTVCKIVFINMDGCH